MADDKLRDFLRRRLPIWRKDPNVYFQDVLYFSPDPWQAEAARLLAENPKVSIKSGC